MDLKIGTCQANDGTKLHHEISTPDRPKGAIVFVHGLGDHIGRYNPFLKFFFARGYKVCLFDLRGHGRSRGRRMDAPNFKTYCEDLFAFYHHCRMLNGREIPWYLVGHSFGGQIALNFLAEHRYLFKAAAVLSSSIEVSLKMPNKWQQGFGELLVKLMPCKRIHSAIDPSWISHDINVQQSYKNDPYIHQFMTFRLGEAILNNFHYI